MDILLGDFFFDKKARTVSPLHTITFLSLKTKYLNFKVDFGGSTKKQ